MSADRPCPDPEPWAGAWRVGSLVQWQWAAFLPGATTVFRTDDGFALRHGDLVLPSDRLTMEVTRPAHVTCIDLTITTEAP